MKTFYNSLGFIETTFSSEEEKDTVYRLIKRHIELMPKVERKRNRNWVFVRDLTCHGSGYSMSICKSLGVDPYGYKWEVEE